MTIDYLVERAAHKHPDKIAIIYENKKISYGKLNKRINQLSNALISLGLKKGDKVGVILYNCPEFIEIIHGISRAGGILVSINYRLTPTELEYILNQSDSRFLIYDKDLQSNIYKIRPNVNIEKYICTGNCEDNKYEGLLKNSSSTHPLIEIEDDAFSTLLYSSGTTGKPKGIILTQKNQIWSSLSIVITQNPDPEDIIITTSPIFHTAALHRSIAAIFIGATMVIMRQFRPIQFLELIEKEKVTIALLIPTMFTMIRQLSKFDKYDLSSVKQITVGAAASSIELLKQVNEVFPNAEVWNGYGLSECPTASALHINRFPNKIDSVGKPHINIEVKIVDTKGEDLPTNQIGEILLRSPNVMKAYYKNQEATKKVYSGNWLHTGDLGKLDEDGFLYIADRQKDMIISGGENIYSKEVEDIIYAHKSVLETAVIGIKDELWGESVRAIVVPIPDSKPTEQEIIDFCAERLAGYKKPRSIIFTDSLPKTASNKIIKGELRKKFGGKID